MASERREALAGAGSWRAGPDRREPGVARAPERHGFLTGAGPYRRESPNGAGP
ncbi:hypothetical protein [Actinomadura luteofluorescens]